MQQDGFDNPYISAGEAAARLEVKRATLYSYASRGLIRTARGDDGRRRLYSRMDVERLRTQGAAHRGQGPVAASALAWGHPVLDSSVTSLESGEVRYRGFSVVELVAQKRTFEWTAELLWSGGPPTGPVLWDLRRGRTHRSGGLHGNARPLDRLLVALVSAAVEDESRFDLGQVKTEERARALLPRLAWALSASDRRFRAPTELAEVVNYALGGRPDAAVRRAVNAALVLCADHELNSSTFAARIAASTGADIYACLLAGLATLTGPKHGGSSDQIEALLSEALRSGCPIEVVRDRMRRGDPVPGFDHPLYPQGDPRAVPLLALAKKLGRRDRATRTILALWRAVARTSGLFPQLDFGLVALTTAVGMRAGAAAAIFALGRTAGWVAHVMEQRRSPLMLRPRARYVG